MKRWIAVFLGLVMALVPSLAWAHGDGAPEEGTVVIRVFKPTFDPGESPNEDEIWFTLRCAPADVEEFLEKYGTEDSRTEGMYRFENKMTILRESLRRCFEAIFPRAEFF